MCAAELAMECEEYKPEGIECCKECHDRTNGSYKLSDGGRVNKYASQRISSLLKNPANPERLQCSAKQEAFEVRGTGIYFFKPPIFCRLSSPAIACITLPAQRNKSALKMHAYKDGTRLLNMLQPRMQGTYTQAGLWLNRQ